MIGNFNEEAQTILNNAKKEMIGLGHPIFELNIYFLLFLIVIVIYVIDLVNMDLSMIILKVNCVRL